MTNELANIVTFQEFVQIGTDDIFYYNPLYALCIGAS